MRTRVPSESTANRFAYSSPSVVGAAESALHLELFSNRRSPTALKYPAGTESAMDMWSNDVVPEEAARRLRDLT